MSVFQGISGEDEARSYVKAWADTKANLRLDRYAELLLCENQKQNLISSASEEHLWVRHLADSAQLLEHVSRETYVHRRPGPWLDLGSGPGLPGMVIAILCPQINVIMVESRSRRAGFLEDCVGELGLDNCTILAQRIERVEPFPARVISARAFAPLDRLIALSAPFSTSETRYLLPKGRSAAHELSQAAPAIRKMFHVKHSLTDPEAGIIVSR
ncbi:16S rRNA (guanine(527)-N(7))-methyltransferase RsmG [Qipengyuania sp. ASV99]|uniref:16S rRNA (guanine(527)-N(7))-methyltransferase RsmG n=1 Tax=Qipengyuania sp. ASV99 TaxID=3399681 RepID=UPI003A4C65F1